jgi:hypothetical protein
MTCGRVDDVAAPRPREIRVVEDELVGAGGERVVELACKLSQRASALVAVQTEVAALDVLGREPGLARARHAHHEHDVAAVGSAPRPRPRPRP